VILIVFSMVGNDVLKGHHPLGLFFSVCCAANNVCRDCIDAAYYLEFVTRIVISVYLCLVYDCSNRNI
jgi:hypothetical protein